MRWAYSGLGLLLLAAAAAAQESAPPGLIRGDFVSFSGTAESGQLIFHTAGNHVYSCTYDHKTYIERDNRRITFAAVDKGDRLEVVTDYLDDSGVCYARMVQIADLRNPFLAPGVRQRPRMPGLPVEVYRPHGDITVAGLVLRVSSDSLLLKSRSGDRETIHLRPDTQYSGDGQAADARSIRLNTLVFIRCGKNLDGDLEAYHVVWGKILQPEP